MFMAKLSALCHYQMQLFIPVLNGLENKQEYETKTEVESAI